MFGSIDEEIPLKCLSRVFPGVVANDGYVCLAIVKILLEQSEEARFTRAPRAIQGDIQRSLGEIGEFSNKSREGSVTELIFVNGLEDAIRDQIVTS